MKNSPLERVSLKNTLLLRHRLGIVQLLLCQGFRLWGIYGSCFRNTERWAMVMFDHQGIVVVPMIWGGHWSEYWSEYWRYFLSQNLLFPSDLWTTTRLHSSLNPLPSTTQQQEENLNWIAGSYVQLDLPRPPPFSSARWTRHRPPPRTPPPPRSREHQSCTCLGCLTWRREKSQIWNPILGNSHLITSLSSSCALYLSLRFFSASLIACCLEFKADLYFNVLIWMIFLFQFSPT